MKKLTNLLVYIGFTTVFAQTDVKKTILTSVVHGLIRHPKILALLCWDQGSFSKVVLGCFFLTCFFR